jgi:hypothetical protein
VNEQIVAFIIIGDIEVEQFHNLKVLRSVTVKPYFIGEHFYVEPTIVTFHLWIYMLNFVLVEQAVNYKRKTYRTP